MKIRIVVLFQSLFCMLISAIYFYRDFDNYCIMENKLIRLAETLVLALIIIAIEHYIINNEKISPSVLTLFPMAYFLLYSAPSVMFWFEKNTVMSKYFVRYSST